MLTIISALYNLYNDEVKNKNYLRRGQYILALDCHKVIYMDQKNYQYLYDRRRSGWQRSINQYSCFNYDDKTIIVYIPYADTYYATYLKDERLKSQKSKKDSREYLTIGNNKFFFLNYTIDAKFWPTDYLMWIDFGIVYSSYSVPRLEITLPPAGKLKCPLIFYQPENLVEYNINFKSIIASGVMIGDVQAWKNIIPLISELFEKSLPLGGCHEKTSLEYLCFSPDGRKLFDLYPADYAHVLLNLSHVVTHSSYIKKSMENARTCKHWEESLNLCAQVIPRQIPSEHNQQDQQDFIDKTFLSELVNESYMAAFYTGQRAKVAELVRFFREESLLDYSSNPKYMIENFKYIQDWVIDGVQLNTITPMVKHKWNMRLVSFFIDIPGGRGLEYYMEKTQLADLDEDIPLTILIEENNLDILKEKFQHRPSTQIILITEEDKRAFKYLETITSNRKETNYQPHPRHTPIYFCCTVTKFLLITSHLKELCDKDKLVWIDYGLLEPITRAKILDLDSCHPKKFEACLIHYRSVSFVNNNHFGYCSIAAGIMAGDYLSWHKVGAAIEELFLQTIDHKHGHGEEQLLSRLYHFHPQWFQLWYGDYDCLLTNYKLIKHKAESVKNFVFLCSYNCATMDSYLVGWYCGIRFFLTKLFGYLGIYEHTDIIGPLYHMGKALQISRLLPESDYHWLQRLYFLQPDANEYLHTATIPVIIHKI